MAVEKCEAESTAHYTQPKYTSCTHQLYYTISSYASYAILSYTQE